MSNDDFGLDNIGAYLEVLAHLDANVQGQLVGFGVRDSTEHHPISNWEVE